MKSDTVMVVDLLSAPKLFGLRLTAMGLMVRRFEVNPQQSQARVWIIGQDIPAELPPWLWKAERQE